MKASLGKGRPHRPPAGTVQALEQRFLLGAHIVKDINLNTDDSNPTVGVEFHGAYVFAASDSSTTRELWKTDGTAAGTIAWDDLSALYPRYNISNPDGFIASSQKLLFYTGGYGWPEMLWGSDGTASGTVPLHAIDVPQANTFRGILSTFDLIDVNGNVFFPAYDPTTNSIDLWKSDGTAAGTVLVSSALGPIITRNSTAVVNGILYFTAASKPGLWRTDGTPTGTWMVQNVPSPYETFDPVGMATMKGDVFFFAQGSGGQGVNLWKSDGMAAGTTIVKQISSPGYQMLPPKLVNVNGTLYFAATAASLQPASLWKSDGTAAGTVQVNGILPQFPGYAISSLTPDAQKGAVFFWGNDPIHGNELWKSDDTSSGTVLVRDINPGVANSVPSQPGGPVVPGTVAPDGTMYFTANDGSHGSELWKTDGTTAGTVLVDDLNPGAGDSNPTNLVWSLGRLFFAATTPAAGNELFESDGTAAGTRLVRDINPGPLVGDLDGDGVVEFSDLVILLRHFGSAGDLPDGGIDGDGFVGFDDLVLLARNDGHRLPTT